MAKMLIWMVIMNLMMLKKMMLKAINKGTRRSKQAVVCLRTLVLTSLC
jgi:hypothetical protein